MKGEKKLESMEEGAEGGMLEKGGSSKRHRELKA